MVETDLQFRFEDLEQSCTGSCSSSSNKTFADVKSDLTLDFFRLTIQAFKVESGVETIAHNLYNYIETSGRSFADFEVEIILDRLGKLFILKYIILLF